MANHILKSQKLVTLYNIDQCHQHPKSAVTIIGLFPWG